MHYKNGREAREGDPVILLNNGRTTVGKVHSIIAGTSTCNCTVAEPVTGGIQQLTCRTLRDMHHAEDAHCVINNVIDESNRLANGAKKTEA